MQLEKKYLLTFFLALKETDSQLSLKEARIRDSFMKPLLEAAQTYEKDRNNIYKTYGELKEDKYHFKPEDVEKVNSEIEELNNETVELPATPSLKEILEKTEYKPKIGESEQIDHILELLIK